MLAYFGTDVIKAKKMPGEDDIRRIIPPIMGEESATFKMMNLNKRSIAFNLKQKQGMEILWKLEVETIGLPIKLSETLGGV